MHLSGSATVLPDGNTADGLAKLARGARDLSEARKVHSLVLESRHGRDKYLANVLIHMFGKCGSVDEARLVFDSINDPNVVAYNIMLATYARNGHLDKARLLFGAMSQRSIVSWNTMLSALAQNGCLEEARRMFSSMPTRDTASSNIMITAAARDGDMKLARQMFDKLQHPNQVSWNAMITAYAKNGSFEQAKELFDRMPSSQRNAVTWTTIVVAYARAGCLREARNLFDRLLKEEEPHQCPLEVWNCMITAYSNWSLLEDAKELFDKMPRRDRVSWRAIVAAYALQRHPSKALHLLKGSPFETDLVCLTVIISGYGRAGDLEAAKTLFEELLIRDVVSWNAMATAAADCGDLEAALDYFDRTPEKNVQSWNCIISGLTKNERLEQAREMFYRMPERDKVSWTLMLTASSQSGRHREAFLLLQLMDREGMNPDNVALACAFDACANFSSRTEGALLHSSIIGSKLETDPLVANAVINMYGKFGLADSAKSVFDRLENADVVSWNAMISALAQNGLVEETERCYSEMQWEGLRPDGITFVALLSASVLAGSLAKAWEFFVAMELDYGLAATAEHFKCMVDVLGRSGRVEDAEELVAGMPFHPNVEEWTCVLSARKIHGAADASNDAALSLQLLDPHSPLPYLL